MLWHCQETAAQRGGAPPVSGHANEKKPGPLVRGPGPYPSPSLVGCLLMSFQSECDRRVTPSWIDRLFDIRATPIRIRNRTRIPVRKRDKACSNTDSTAGSSNSGSRAE